MSDNSVNTNANIERLLTTVKSKAFLGKEFLTWIWFHSEQADHQFVIDSPTLGKISVQLWVDDRIVLESQTSKAHHQTLKGGEPSQSLEASAALKAGKSVKEIRVGFNVEGVGEFTCNLNCTELNPSSVRLPDLEEDDQNSNSLPLIIFRLKTTKVLVEVIDGLFRKFLEERVEDNWPSQGLEKIRNWIENRFSAANSYLH